MLGNLITLLGASRVRAILGATCAVVCFLGGWWIKGLSADKVIADVRASYAQKTAEALEAVRKEQEDEITNLNARIAELGEVLSKREDTIATLRLSRSDLDAQLCRLRDTVRDLSRSKTVQAVSDAGNACSSCWRAYNDLRILAREGAELLVEGSGLYNEATNELGTLLTDRDAVRELTQKK